MPDNAPTNPERKTGVYWVRMRGKEGRPGKVRIAEWYGRYEEWVLPGQARAQADSDFAAIGPRIIPPPEFGPIGLATGASLAVSPDGPQRTIVPLYLDLTEDQFMKLEQYLQSKGIAYYEAPQVAGTLEEIEAQILEGK